MMNPFIRMHGIGGSGKLSVAIAMALLSAPAFYASAQTVQPVPSTNQHTTSSEKKNTMPSAKRKAAVPPTEQNAQKLSGMTVNGFASSLSRAQEIKRSAATVVDAISAENALSLPYESVTEALQRIPGVTVSAFGIASDPDHFSIQGRDISLEGLPYISTQFNGQQVFSAGGGEGLNFFTVSPQLIGSVVVKKNQTADMIPGGIAGTITLNTRKPFNSNKTTQAALSVGTYWGTLSRHSSPQLAGLFSHIFNTSAGRFGILDNYAYDKINQTDNAISLVNFQRRCNGCILPGNRPDSFPGIAPGKFVYVPVGGDLRVQNEASNRVGNVLVGQWESPDKSWHATLEWDHVADTELTYEHTLQASTDGCAFGALSVCGIPLAGTNPVFNSDGVMTSGVITALPTPSTFLPLTYGGMQTQLDTTGFRRRFVTDNYSLHMKWRVNDRLQLSANGQYTKSTLHNLYYYVRQLTNVNWGIGVHGFGLPSLTLLSPDPAQSPAQYFANPNNIYWAAAQDEHTGASGNLRAFRLDGVFSIDQDFMDNIRFGVRRAKQRETVKSAAYNYVAISAPYGQNAVTVADTPGDTSLQVLNYPAFNRDFGIAAPYFKLNPLNFARSVAIIRAINQKFIAMNPGNSGNPYFTDYDRPQNVPGSGGYEPQEISTNGETINAGYVQLDFGNDSTNFLSNLQISGNIGVRFVHTRDRASGFLTLPNQSLALNGLSIQQFCLNQTRGGSVASPGTFCALTPTQQQQYVRFADGSYTPISAGKSYDNLLPSFNLAVGWTPNLITRFAFSDSIYRPTLVQLQAGQPIGGLLPYGTNGSTVPTVSGGNTSSNPFLKPITAHNFDISQGWYFGKIGSLTALVFFKQLNNTIQNITSVIDTTATNNGVTFPEQRMVGLANLNKKENLSGVELAYQQQYSFLPGWLSGFGTKMNYTYIKSHGLNYGSKDFCPATYVPATQCINQTTLPPIELSRDNANFIVFYDKGAISTRLGWNWRSAYLVTGFEADYPFVPVMAEAQGQLNGSFSYALNSHLKLSLQVANILNSTYKTREIINTAGLEVPKGFFRDDTRFHLGLRMSF